MPPPIAHQGFLYAYPIHNASIGPQRRSPKPKSGSNTRLAIPTASIPKETNSLPVVREFLAGAAGFLPTVVILMLCVYKFSI